jgi:hypothetical protein
LVLGEGKSPFSVLYGREPKHLDLTMVDVPPISDVQEWLHERQVMVDLLKQHLCCAQHRMKVQADKRRSERSFHVGDQVYLKLQPYVQLSVARRANHKLAFKFFGPFSVIKKIGEVAYKLQLREESKIHPVFHVAQLKPARPRLTRVIPTIHDSASLFKLPLKILEHCWRKGSSKLIRQGLVHWSNAPPDALTWEDLEDLHHRFPAAPAWESEKLLDYRWHHLKDGTSLPIKQVRVLWNYASPGQGVWEDMEQLRRRFPDAAAWGQATLQGEGIVRNTANTSSAREEPGPSPRPPRTRQPNKQVFGPDWVNIRAAQATTTWRVTTAA